MISEMMDLVDDHVPVWSPVARHDCAQLSPHSHGFSLPHSHMLKAMWRPDSLSALPILG
eukprot:COSAG01_NODE_4374_length_5087_cov_2.572374_2_plen_59_part_00